MKPLISIEISNQSVVVCDLRTWTGTDVGVSGWTVLKGTQDEVGRAIAELFGEAGITRIDDFGGVCETFLCDGETYLDNPPRTIGGSAVFSFTPKKRIATEGFEMARVSKAAGYDLLVLTVQKEGKFGKVWVLCGILKHLPPTDLVYYEDTASVVDELKTSAEGSKVTVVHVQSPGYENHASGHADRVVTQLEYQKEVLASQY